MALPKLEGIITIPTGGWSVDVQENGTTSDTITVAAADYYHSSVGTGSNGLLTQFQTNLNASGTLAGTYTVALSDTTGKVTISVSGGGVTSLAFTWTSTDFRNALGWDGTETGTTSFTGTEQADYLWLAPVKRENGMAPEPGALTDNFGKPKTDGTFTRSPDGSSVRLAYATVYDDTLNFGKVIGNKCWKTLESTTNESFQRFWDLTIGLGHAFRYHKDVADDALYWTLTSPNFMEFNADAAVPGWWDGANSLWNIRFDVVPIP